MVERRNMDKRNIERKITIEVETSAATCSAKRKFFENWKKYGLHVAVAKFEYRTIKLKELVSLIFYQNI
jgi:hypothetical protein